MEKNKSGIDWRETLFLKQSPDSYSSLKLQRLLLAGIIALIAGVQLFPNIAWSPEKIAVHGLFSDDAYFFSVLARHFDRFGFLTMDGEMPTNGVQPLWMFIQIILVKLFPSVHEAKLLSLSSWCFYVMFSFLTVWFITKERSSKNVVPVMIVAGMIILNRRFQIHVVTGLETPLVLFMIMLFLLYLDYLEGKRRGSHSEITVYETMGLSVLSVLCFFARLDFFIIAFVAGIWLIVKRISFKKTVLYFAFVSLMVLPYLIYNEIAHGNIVPISGRVKLFYLNLVYPTVTGYLKSNEWKGLFTAFTLPFPSFDKSIFFSVAFTLTAIFTCQIAVWKKKNSAIFPQSIKIFSVIILAHIILMEFYYREASPYNTYYFAPDVCWAVMVLAFYVSRDTGFNACSQGESGWKSLLNPFSRYVPGFLAVLSMVLVLTTWVYYLPRPSIYWTERMNLAKDVDRMIPPGRRVAAFWPGMFSQFSNRLVTPLDGIIGSNAFFENYVKEGKELDYIMERSRPYLILYLPDSPDTILDKPCPTTDWFGMYRKRLCEYKEKIRIKIISSRLLEPNKSGRGWYLVELKVLFHGKNENFPIGLKEQ